jgi:glycosyltransferase involved in cell wall biosynthesis
MSSALLTTPSTPAAEVDGRPFALVVGDSSPRKNLAMVVDLWPEVVARRPDATLVIVGPPSWGPGAFGALEPLLRTGAATVLHHRPDAELRWLYENAAAVLCPSQQEGFGLPVVEAHALGAPVILSDDAAMGEVSGDGATAISLHDRTGWRDAILAAFSSSATRRSGAGGSATVSRTWSDVADETVEVVRRAR